MRFSTLILSAFFTLFLVFSTALSSISVTFILLAKPVAKSTFQVLNFS